MLPWKRMLFMFGAVVAFTAAFFVLFRSGLPERAQFTGQITADGLTIAPEIDAIAPAFELSNVQGNTISLSKLRGKPVVVNFWATWCEPCKVEMPALEAVYHTYKNQGLHLLAVNLGESRETASAWAREMKLTFDILLDPTQATGALYQLRGQPSTYVIAPSGIITHIYYGPTSESALKEALAPYFSN
jgi:peroxiredoxin